mgnify:CR=1
MALCLQTNSKKSLRMSTQINYNSSTNIKSLIEASITFLKNKEFDTALYCLDKIKKN